MATYFLYGAVLVAGVVMVFPSSRSLLKEDQPGKQCEERDERRVDHGGSADRGYRALRS